MKIKISILLLLCALLCGCTSGKASAQVVATTRPVYDFTTFLCRDTDITVDLLVTENVSCLHDYTLQVRQMRAIEGAQVVVLSGTGLEDFLTDALCSANAVIDSSEGIALLCAEHDHDHGDDGHHHEQDPHIWLSVSNAGIMTENICNGLIEQFPQHRDTLLENLEKLQGAFSELEAYGQQALSSLKSRELITFHDGFGYFADYWGLSILHSLEEEAGSEASAGQLKELITLVRQNDIPAIFVEENGSASAAQIISAETGTRIYALNMGMSDKNYFESMYQNIDTIKEALG